MAITLLNGGGSVHDPAVVNMRASGTIHPNGVVDLLHTAGQGVSVSSGASTSTMVFGVALDYAQGASDVEVRVIPFNKQQLWAADCYNTALTSHIGLRHELRTTGTDARARFVENTASDVQQENGGVFLALGVDLTKGSGKLIGRFIQTDDTDLLSGL